MHVKYILPCSLITIYGLESMMVFHHDIILNTVKIIEGETTSSNVNLDDLMTGWPAQSQRPGQRSCSRRSWWCQHWCIPGFESCHSQSENERFNRLIALIIFDWYNLGCLSSIESAILLLSGLVLVVILLEHIGPLDKKLTKKLSSYLSSSNHTSSDRWSLKYFVFFPLNPAPLEQRVAGNLGPAGEGRHGQGGINISSM